MSVFTTNQNHQDSYFRYINSVEDTFMGVSTMGVSTMGYRYSRQRDTPKNTPRHLFAGKARCNRIKDLYLRTFDTEKLIERLSGVRIRRQTRAQLPARQWCSKL